MLRTLVRLTTSLASILLLLAASETTAHAQTVTTAMDADVLFLTTAPSVRLRSAPSTDAAVLATLPIGTEVRFVPSIPGHGWRQVATPSNQIGWVLDSLVKPLDPARRSETIAALVLPRLTESAASRPGDPFASRRQVADLLERTLLLEGDRGLRGNLTLLYIRALGAALGALASQRSLTATDRAWIDGHAAVVIQTVAGAVVRPEFMRQVHQRYGDTAASEEIAWYLAEQGRVRECDADAACYVREMNLTSGDYLRWHADSRRSSEAVKRVGSLLDTTMKSLQVPSEMLAGFTPERCKELLHDLDPLIEAVERATAPPDVKNGTLATLGRYRRLCDKP